MFSRAKEKFYELAAKKAAVYSKFGMTKDKNSDSEVSPTSPVSFLRTPSRPLNDVLPPEILIEIFKIVDRDAWVLSYKVIENLSLVCRSWRDAALGMELLNFGVSNSGRMDALLAHIHTTPLFQKSKRANIHGLSATADKEKEFHRLPELLTLCRTSLQRLYLSRSDEHDPETELFQDATVEDQSDFYCPNLTTLRLTKLTPRELTSLLTLAHPPKLAHLELRHTFLYYDDVLTEELTSLRFPNLKEIVIVGFFRAENPTLAWLCQIAPNLETLELTIVRDRLPPLTEFMASDQILKNFQKLKLWIRIRHEDLDPDSPDLAALIRVIKERGWTYWINVSISVGSWVYEG